MHIDSWGGTANNSQQIYVNMTYTNDTSIRNIYLANMYLACVESTSKSRQRFWTPNTNSLLESEKGSRWPFLTLHVGSYSLHKTINTYDTVALLLGCAFKHATLIPSSLLSFSPSANRVALGLRGAISCKLSRTVWKPSRSHVVLNCLLLAMFLESLPAAPQPLMAPWAHIAVLTLAKSQPPPAC